LPFSRSLAGQLSIDRGTIELAYALLADEGYVAGMRRTGTIVNAGLSRNSMRILADEIDDELAKETVGHDYARTIPFVMLGEGRQRSG
jgi:DNA-binding transcriptional regulator YhcF (GntR family)